MAKDLIIYYFGKDKMDVSVATEEPDTFHKNQISVNEPKIMKMATEISDQVKYIKGFKNFAITFGMIDWYENCNGYEVPSFGCTDENKNIQKKYSTYNDIPKDWTRVISLTMEIPISIKGLNKFFTALRLNLSQPQINQIKKSIKERKPLRIEL